MSARCRAANVRCGTVTVLGVAALGDDEGGDEAASDGERASDRDDDSESAARQLELGELIMIIIRLETACGLSGDGPPRSPPCPHDSISTLNVMRRRRRIHSF